LTVLYIENLLNQKRSLLLLDMMYSIHKIKHLMIGHHM